MVTAVKWRDVCLDWLDARNRNLAAISLAVSALFLTFASVYTSPLNPYYGSDAAVFMVIGKGVTQGLVPYVDLYDHKGPLLFFFNALGYLLFDGKVGVLLVQILFFAVCLYFVYKMARLFVSSGYACWMIVAFCYYYITLVEGGNLSEEWSLLFTVLPMYLSLRFAMQQQPIATHPLWHSFVYGLCLGAQVFIRLNNASIVCGIILAFVILLCIEKSYQAIFANAGVVLLGVLCVAAPIFLYFALHGAVDAFLQAAFVDYFVYALNGADTKTWQDICAVLVRLLLFHVAIFAAYRLYKGGTLGKAPAILTVCMGSVSAPLLFLGYGYLHYYLVFAPFMVLALCLACKAFAERQCATRRAQLAFVAVLLLAVAPFAYRFARQVGVNLMMDFFDYNQAEVACVTQIMSNVPEDEMDSVWAYDTNARFYLYADVLPCYTYFVSQSFHAQAAPEIATEIDTMLTTDAPLWVVTGVAAEELSNETLQSVLEAEYVLVDAAEYGLGLYLYQKVS